MFHFHQKKAKQFSEQPNSFKKKVDDFGRQRIHRLTFHRVSVSLFQNALVIDREK